MSRNYDTDLFTEHQAAMLKDADAAITQCGLWDWLRDYTPEHGKGFMFSEHPNLDRINEAMKLYDSHSGASYGWVMSGMNYIAKHGWDLFEFTVREERRKQERDRNERKANEMARVLFLSNETTREIMAEAMKKSNGNPTPLDVAEAGRNRLPDGEQQYDAIKKFSEGKMSYAEMRSLCG